MKKALVFALILTVIGAIGGCLIGMYTFTYYTEEMRELILAQVGSYQKFCLLTMAQSALYVLVASFSGYLMSSRLGLMRPLTFDGKVLKKVMPQIVLAGVIFFLDAPVFGHFIPEVAAEYEKGITVPYFFASLIYGGICEEVLLRLFFMTAIAFVISLIQRKRKVSDWVLGLSDIIAALVFAAGHIQTTISLFGRLDALILFRCFLLNGAFGLLFGYYYIKYGIQYSMLAHFGIHFVSKVLLLIFCPV
ncbi:MAG: CPBP family intramembrane glutamic endopeptidase [Bullifex sp.]